MTKIITLKRTVSWAANRGLAITLTLLVGLASLLPAHASTAYANWAAVVVSGDWHAHDGRPSQIFDNARRDVTRDLVALGFARDHIAELSARPGAQVPRASISNFAKSLRALSNRTSGGCLIYFSSHGSPDGIVVGNVIFEPPQLKRVLNYSCAEKPTVVVLSACFSGAFVHALSAPNRMILTAARADRTSFGCGQTDRYPYFDQCVLSVWPYASGFAALGRAAQICVAARERREHVGPPSEPQLWVGAAAASDIPKWH